MLSVLLTACLSGPATDDDRGPHYEAPALLLGAYSADYLGTPEAVQSQLGDFDDLVSTPLSFGGVFVGVEDPNPAYDVPAILGSLFDAGYTPFVNLASNHTMAQLAGGELDTELRAIADATAAWALATPGALVFLAPLPEMNGDWETYEGDPDGFKQFFTHLQELFAEAGVPRDAVRWVFAPNGWNPEGHPLERYYPGDDRVDAIGFSAYQWGACIQSGWPTPREIYLQYVERIGILAPDKPIFVAQTGVSSTNEAGQPDPDAKDAFLEDAYQQLGRDTQVLGVLYFNLDKECDWAVFRQGEVVDGYRSAARGSRVGYLPAAEVAAEVSGVGW